MDVSKNLDEIHRYIHLVMLRFPTRRSRNDSQGRKSDCMMNFAEQVRDASAVEYPATRTSGVHCTYMAIITLRWAPSGGHHEMSIASSSFSMLNCLRIHRVTVIDTVQHKIVTRNRIFMNIIQIRRSTGRTWFLLCITDFVYVVTAWQLRISATFSIILKEADIHSSAPTFISCRTCQ